MTTRSTYLITKSAYYFDWFQVPVAALTALGGALHAGVAMDVFLPSVIVGGLSWSLAEYWVHLLVFHGSGESARQHAIHHREPAEYIGVHPRSTGAWFVALGVGLPWLLGASIGFGFYIGFVLWYFAYILLHDGYHHGRTGGFLTKHHQGHHRNGRSNFGVSTPLWDYVFRTKSRPGGALPDPRL